MVSHLLERAPSFRRFGWRICRIAGGWPCMGAVQGENCGRATVGPSLHSALLRRSFCIKNLKQGRGEARPLKFFRRAALLVGQSAEFALDKRINISVHDRLDVAGFDTRPMILHHLVRLEDV